MTALRPVYYVTIVGLAGATLLVACLDGNVTRVSRI